MKWHVNHSPSVFHFHSTPCQSDRACLSPVKCASFVAFALIIATGYVALAKAPEPPLPSKRGTAIPVTIDSANGMQRGGAPYFVKGAGGTGSLKDLAARGGNSIRTWTTNRLDKILDEAQALNITVSAGIWLEHECSWFSYHNPVHCDAQAERVRREVMLYRDHPALLAWGIGNEVEGDGQNIAFWKQIDRLARLVKELDPAHPTFTALAGANPAKVAGLSQHAPHLDFMGINTYGAIFRLRSDLQKLGWNRPWMLTEWGPRGFWESPKTSFDAPIEQTSTEKAEMIRKAYQTTIANEGGCLGSYVFVWGWKFESTATWFGIYTHHGHITAVADALQESWGGGIPVNKAPTIQPLRGLPKTSVPRSARFEVTTSASDLEGDPLTWKWAVLPEHRGHASNTRKDIPKALSGIILKTSEKGASIKVPAKKGFYRLYTWVTDTKGQTATANAPFAVD